MFIFETEPCYNISINEVQSYVLLNQTKPDNTACTTYSKWENIVSSYYTTRSLSFMSGIDSGVKTDQKVEVGLSFDTEVRN